MLDNNQESTDDGQQKTYCSPRSTLSSGFMTLRDYWEKRYCGERVGVNPEMAKIIDKFCSSQCSEKDPPLKTAYKADCKKNTFKRKLHNLSTSRDKVVRSEAIPFNGLVRIIGQQNENNLKSASSKTSYPDFENTTFQSAKFAGKEKFQSSTVSLQSGSRYRKKSKPKVKELNKSYRPGCTGGTSREESQNCTDNSGKTRCSNSFKISETKRFSFEIPKPSAPSATDKQLKEKLTDIRKNVYDVETQIEAVDIKIMQLIQKINMAKRSGNNFKIFQSEEPVKCSLCGTQVQTKLVGDHLKECYKRYERKFSITGYTEMLHDPMWNVLCDHKLSKRAHCRNLKALCRLHGNYFRKDDEVCGYELARNLFCGDVGKTCGHVDWEALKRAQLDIEKLKLIFKLKQLNEEERKIKNEMASRGDLTG